MTKPQIVKAIQACFLRGNKVLVFGNGGSLADASHWAAEFHSIGPVIALNDAAKITSIGNDFGFDLIFVKQVVDLGNRGDIAIGISSSGNSENVRLALIAGAGKGLEIIDWPRKGNTTQEVQNFQYKLLHEVFIAIKK